MFYVCYQPFEERQRWFYENLYGKGAEREPIYYDEKNVVEVKRGKYFIV